jgi:hypothetical protein
MQSGFEVCLCSSFIGKWSGRVEADVSGADAAGNQQQAAVVFVAGWAVVRWCYFFSAFGGLLDERLADA